MYVVLRVLYSSTHILDGNLNGLLVLSRFNYADAVYSACLMQTDVYKIQKVQNSCLHFIY